MDVRARARRIKQQNGDLGVVIIDYLQLMSSRGRAENRQVEGLGDEPITKDPRARTRVSCGGPVAALTKARRACRQAANDVGPS